MTAAEDIAATVKAGYPRLAGALREWVRDTRACLQPTAPGPSPCTVRETVHGYTVKCTHAEHPGPWHNDPVVGSWRRGWMS